MTNLATSEYRDAALRRFLTERRDDLLSFAQELIRTPSPNPPGDERAVAALARDKLLDLGIDDIDVLSAVEERPNLVARIGSGSGPTLILGGHLDTKPPGEIAAWRLDPYRASVENGELTGLGSGDMKGAVAAMIFAAGALQATGKVDGNLVLVLTADEEAGSRFGAQWLAENGHLKADAALLGEPCGVVREWESIDVVSRGAALFKVRVRGTQMHSSVSDRLPSVNATVKMARLIDRMDRELKGRLRFPASPLPGLEPTVNVGVMVSGGVYYGVYPGHGEFACDIRTVPGMTRESVEEDLRLFLAGAANDDPELDADLNFEIWVPATKIGEGHPLVVALREASAAVLGAESPLGVFPGATDASHFQLVAGIDTVAAFGPGFLPRAHSPNESVSVAGIEQAAELYALAARRFLRLADDR